jgi:hypothetical protein
MTKEFFFIKNMINLHMKRIKLLQKFKYLENFQDIVISVF